MNKTGFAFLYELLAPLKSPCIMLPLIYVTVILLHRFAFLCRFEFWCLFLSWSSLPKIRQLTENPTSFCLKTIPCDSFTIFFSLLFFLNMFPIQLTYVIRTLKNPRRALFCNLHLNYIFQQSI